MKGFTLVELLAVIVILVIILVISVPIIGNLIDNVKTSALESSSKGLLKAAEFYVANEKLNGVNETVLFKIENGVITSTPAGRTLEFDGEIPKDGEIKILASGEVLMALYENGKCAVSGYNDGKVEMTEIAEVDCILPNQYAHFTPLKGVNAPKLSTGMIAVEYNGTNWLKVGDPTSDTDWYSYTNADKKWANAVYVKEATRAGYLAASDGTVVNMADIVMFMVWIPRYAYSITTNYHTGTAGNIDIKFLVDDTNFDLDENEYVNIPTYSGSSQTNFVVHPGFKLGTEELEGFWAMKFEISNDGTGKIESLPSKTVYSGNNVTAAYNLSYNIRSNTAKYGFLTDEVDTHLTKPTEWGAISYLAQSVYGKNSEVYINNSTNGSTGCGGNLVDSAAFAGCQNLYNSTNGEKASTTGNVYGIYDMNGGLYEYVAAYINGGNSALNTNGSALVAADSKYKVVYSPGTPDWDNTNYEINKTIIGDGIYETSSNIGISNGWYGDRVYMPNTSGPFFGLGGYASYAATSGIFGTIYSDGSGNGTNTFRPIIVVN